MQINSEGLPTVNDLLFKDSQLEECGAHSKFNMSDVCDCATCKGKRVDDQVTSPRCKWQKAHRGFMKRHKLCPRLVGSTFKMTQIGTARQRHIIAVVHRLNEKIAKEGGKPILMVNVSQALQRCSFSKKQQIPVLTPGGRYYHVESQRLLTPEESFMMMGFDLSSLDLGSLSQGEIASLAGNAMHVRMIGLSLLLALALVDTEKFLKGASKNQKKTKLVGAQCIT